jgi:RHS repeat-associated protein
VAAGVPKQKLEFVYDSAGRRVAKRVSSWNLTTGAWDSAAERRFLYDGWNLIAEFSASASALSLVRTYGWGTDLSGTMQGAGGVGGLLAVSTGIAASETFCPTYDGNGNILGYARLSDSIIVASFEYGPFGEAVRASGANLDQFAFRFSTKYQDVETGLLYYGLRYYNPSTGRWPSRDPIEERGGANLYGMVGNDPVNGFDPFGLAESTYILRVVKDEYTLSRQMDLGTAKDLAQPLIDALGALRGLGGAESLWDAGKSAYDLVDAVKKINPTVDYLKNFLDTKGWPITQSEGRAYSAEIDSCADKHFMISRVDVSYQGPESFGEAGKKLLVHGVRQMSLHVTFQITRWYVWYDPRMQNEMKQRLKDFEGDIDRYESSLRNMDNRTVTVAPGISYDESAPSIWNQSIQRYSKPGTQVQIYPTMQSLPNPLENMNLDQIFSQ